MDAPKYGDPEFNKNFQEWLSTQTQYMFGQNISSTFPTKESLERELMECLDLDTVEGYKKAAKVRDKLIVLNNSSTYDLKLSK